MASILEDSRGDRVKGWALVTHRRTDPDNKARVIRIWQLYLNTKNR